MIRFPRWTILFSTLFIITFLNNPGEVKCEEDDQEEDDIGQIPALLDSEQSLDPAGEDDDNEDDEEEETNDDDEEEGTDDADGERDTRSSDFCSNCLALQRRGAYIACPNCEIYWWNSGWRNNQ